MVISKQDIDSRSMYKETSPFQTLSLAYSQNTQQIKLYIYNLF